MTDAPGREADPRLVELVELWHRACSDFVELARTLTPEQGDLPTDLDGWSVKDNVAHTAHLEAVLAGAPDETVEVPEAPHLRGPMSYYTEQGVLARRGRSLPDLAEEIETAVATRHAALVADPPSDAAGSPPKTPGGIGWTWATLLTNRPVDVWMHEQDIRRAIDRPRGYDGPVAAHVIGVFGRALAMVVGKRVSPPSGTTVRLLVPDAGRDWAVRVGDDGRAGFVDPEDASPDVTVSMSAQDYVVLSGGRRPVSATGARLEGDRELGARLLESLAVTP